MQLSDKAETPAPQMRPTNCPACTTRRAEWLPLRTFNDLELLRLREATVRWRTDALLDPKRMGGYWLSLLGKTGTGKTLCAQALWREVKLRCDWHPYPGSVFTPNFIYWPQLIADMQNRLRYDEYGEMHQWPYLFLDDVGAENDKTGFSGERLGTLLAQREQMYTVITSNLLLPAIAQWDARIADRMLRHSSVVVQLTTTPFTLRNQTP